MKLPCFVTVLLALPLALAAQDSSTAALPPGTLLPVRLEHGLNAQKLHAGQKIRMELMQTVPGTHVKRGAQVMGRVVAVNSAAGAPEQLAIRLDTIESHGQRLAVRTSVRAVASALEVEMAHVPEEMSSRGLTPETWTTQQIGGDQVYRGGGPVTEGKQVVGKPVAWGVEGHPQSHPGTACHGEPINGRPQALWLFSANACGVYGVPGVRIEHAGRSNGGTIVLTAPSGKLNLYGGGGMLLRVEGESSGQ